jgi:hypothetical protein
MSKTKELRKDRITVRRARLTAYRAAHLSLVENRMVVDPDGLTYICRWETWDNRDNGSGEYASDFHYYQTLKEVEHYLSLYKNSGVEITRYKDIEDE